MIKYRDYPFKSVLTPYIRDFIAEKRALGFIYNNTSYQLYQLDTYWYRHGYTDPHITLARLSEWLMARPGESKAYHSARVTAAKGLSIYLNVHEIISDIPLISIGADHPVVHILDQTELHQFFDAVDSYVPQNCIKYDYLLADEYPIIFRMLYCCGLRINEACSLKVADVDFEEGILTILDGKNNKDRLVYLPEDLCILIKKYFVHLQKSIDYEPLWLFPGKTQDKHISKNTVERRFKMLWYKTKAASQCDKDPTPHCLRHGFVVNRMNRWVLEGVDINYMRSYLSKYLGHKDPDESFYYYHLVSDAFRILKQKDTVSNDVIPEVRRI